MSDSEPNFLEPKALRRSVVTYKKDSLGADGWVWQEVAQLPDVSLFELTDAINAGKSLATIPHQDRLHMHPLLGKPRGFRTMFKTPTLYRLDSRTDKEVREWEVAIAGLFDTCIPGASSLEAALIRNAAAECVTLVGSSVAGLFNDFHKFFDTLDLDILMSRAIKAAFPVQILNTTMQQHLAPRALQARVFTTNPIEVNRSILAGCKFSVALTRAYLLEEVSKVDVVHAASISTYVDETPFLDIGSYSKVHNNIADLGVVFCKAVKRLKLQLSPKVLLVANPPKLALALQKELRE